MRRRRSGGAELRENENHQIVRQAIEVIGLLGISHWLPHIPTLIFALKEKKNL